MNLIPLDSANLSIFLPSVADMNALQDNFVIHCARVLVKKLPFLSKFSDCVPQHIGHEFSKEMSQKSTAVSAYMVGLFVPVCMIIEYS